MFGLFGGKKGRNTGGDSAPPIEPGPGFSVPGYADRSQAESALADVRARLAAALKAPVSEQAFAALTYEHDAFTYRAEVGVADPRANEVVKAILRQPDKRRFLIVTDRHGFAGGLPLLVAEREVTAAVAFRDA